MVHRFHLQIVDRTWCDFSLMVFERMRRRFAQAKEGLDEHGDSTIPVEWTTIQDDLKLFSSTHSGLVLRVTVDETLPAYVYDGQFVPNMSNEEYNVSLCRPCNEPRRLRDVPLEEQLSSVRRQC
jgi:hypothetical protein